MEPVYQFVRPENITGLAFVAIDPPDDLVHRPRNINVTNDMVFNITSVGKPVSWGLRFEENFSRRQYCPPNEDDLDSDEFNEIFHPWS